MHVYNIPSFPLLKSKGNRYCTIRAHVENSAVLLVSSTHTFKITYYNLLFLFLLSPNKFIISESIYISVLCSETKTKMNQQYTTGNRTHALCKAFMPLKSMIPTHLSVKVATSC